MDMPCFSKSDWRKHQQGDPNGWWTKNININRDMFIEKLNTENKLIAVSFRSSERLTNFPPSNLINPCCLFHRPYYQAWQVPILQCKPEAFIVLNIAQAKLQGTLQHRHIHLASAFEKDLHRDWLKRAFPFAPFCCVQHSWDAMAQGGTTLRRRTCSSPKSKPKSFLGKEWF